MSTRRTKREPAGRLRLVGYQRVSTAEQAESGAGLEAQHQSIKAAARERDWQIVTMCVDAGISGGTIERPGLTEALALVERGEADGIVVSKLDRLSRSLLDFAALMERSRRKGWALIALDLGVDTTTPAGEMVANVMASFAQFERRLIGQRTKDALAVKKAQGTRLGRPRVLPDDVVERIVTERQAGASLDAIASGLNRDRVPTARGGDRWYGSSVSAVLAYGLPPD